MTYWPLNLVLHHLPYRHPFHHADPTTQIRAFLPHDLTKTRSCPWDQGPRQQRWALSHHKVPLQWALITPLWTTQTTWHCSSPQTHRVRTGTPWPVENGKKTQGGNSSVVYPASYRGSEQ